MSVREIHIVVEEKDVRGGQREREAGLIAISSEVYLARAGVVWRALRGDRILTVFSKFCRRRGRLKSKGLWKEW